MTTTRPPLDREPRRIDLTSEEQWFLYRVLRGHLRGGCDDATQPVASALGKVEAGVSSFTLREARRLRDAVTDYARDPDVSFGELALSMAVVERVDRTFDLPAVGEPERHPRRSGPVRSTSGR